MAGLSPKEAIERESKLQSLDEQWQAQCGQGVINSTMHNGEPNGPQREWTLADEKEKSFQRHVFQAEKDKQAVDFLTKHPEFGEFIQLIRQGVISI